MAQASSEALAIRTGFIDNPIPIAVNCVSKFMEEFYHRILNDGDGFNFTKTSDEAREVLHDHFFLSQMNIVHIVACAVLVTIIRHLLDFLIFKPMPKWLQANKENAEKMPESLWKGSAYLVTWLWAVYIMYSRPYLFFQPASHWHDWGSGLEITPDIYWLYMTQMAFYLHCVYATLFIETRRKDFLVLMIHHVLTLSLLLFSFAIKFHKVGLMVLFLHDIGDVMLELSKVVVYCRYRGKKERPFVEQLANICFLLFTAEWVVFRLYWFVIKVLYSTAYMSLVVHPEGPFYIMFNIMLTVLYIMQVYWFTFIVSLILRVMVGGKVEDIREDDDSSESKESGKDASTTKPAEQGSKQQGTPKSTTRKRKAKANTD